MASFTQAIAGDRSNPATWGNVVSPGDGDTCVCKYALNWDTDTPIGLGGATGTEAIKIEAGGVLTVPDGVTLNLKGDINVYRGGRYHQVGDLNVIVGSGVTYYLRGKDSPYSPAANKAVIEFEGVSVTNRATVTKTGLGTFSIGGAAYADSFTCTSFVNFLARGIGSPTVSAFAHPLVESGVYSYARNAAWVECGLVTIQKIGATNVWDWENIYVINPVTNPSGAEFTGPAFVATSATEKTTGTRRLVGYYAIGAYNESWVQVRGLEYSDIYLVNHKLYTTSSTAEFGVQHKGSRIMQIVDESWFRPSPNARNATICQVAGQSGNVYEDIVILARCANQHHFGSSLGSLGLARPFVKRALFDGDDFFSGDTGDCFMPSGELEAENVWTINKAGCPASMLTSTGKITFNRLTSDKNYHIAVGETNGGPNQLPKVKNSLFTNQNRGLQQNSAFQPQNAVDYDFNGFWNMTDATNLTHPTLGVRSYMGPENVASWEAAGVSEWTGSHDKNVDPQYVDNTRTVRTWFGHVLGVDTSDTVTWTPTRMGEELIKIGGLDKDGNNATPVAGLTVSACLDWVTAGYAPQNVALKGAGEGLQDIGASAVYPTAPAVNHVWIDDLTTKYRRGGEDGISGPSSLTMDIYRNCIESFQILIHSEAGLSNVDVTISAINGPSGATITDIYKYFQWYHKCTNVSRVEYEPGEYPDALIPDVDRYRHEKRNRFPFSIAAGKVQGVLFDIGTVESQPVGTYTATVTVTADGVTIGTCSVSFVVHDVTLSSTSDFPVDIPALSPHVGYGFPWTTTGQYWYDLMADHTKCGLYHDVSISCNWIGPGFHGMTWNNDTQQLVVNSWLPQDAWIVQIANGSFISSGPYAGAKQAVIRPYRFWPADNNSNSTVPMEYRSLATRQYFTQMWDHLVSIGAEPDKYFFIPPFYDEPSASEYTMGNFRGPTTAQSYVANNETVKDTIHLNGSTFRRTFLTCAKNESLAEFELYGFFAVGTQAPACKTYDHTCIYEVPSSLQTRDKYDPSEHWWLYPTCVSNACGQVGNNMYSGSADIVVDADALYHLFHGPLWYLYGATGSLYWSVISYLSSGISDGLYDPWDNAWRNNAGDGYNNGDSLMIYPGIASGTGRTLTPATPIIGGTHDIPIESWRMKTLWRDAIRFVRLCKAAEARHGRAAVLEIVNTLFETGYPDEQKYWHLNTDPDYYRAAKQGILELVASAVTIPAPVISALSTPSVTGTTTATATLSTTVSGGNLRYVVTANAIETNATITAGTAQAVLASGAQTLNMTGLTPGGTRYLHIIHDGLGGLSNTLHSVAFTLNAEIDNTAAVLTNATGVAVTQTTATGTVTTDKADGTLYFLAGASVGEAQVLAGNSQPVTTVGIQNVSLSGLADNSPHQINYLHVRSNGRMSNLLSSSVFNTPAYSVIPKPVLSAISVTVNSTTTATVSLTTDRSDGQLRYIISADATTTQEAVLAGSTVAITAVGIQTFQLTGLTAGTTQYVFVCQLGDGGASNIISKVFTLASESVTPAVVDVDVLAETIIMGKAKVITTYGEPVLLDHISGDTWIRSWIVNDLSLIGATAKLHLRDVYKTLVATATTVNGKLQISTVSKRVDLRIDSTEMQLPVGLYAFNLELTTSDGIVRTLERGVLRIQEDTTHA